MKLTIETRAADLPDEWNKLVGENPYLTKDFLAFIEKTERDYHPKYYLFYDGARADSCFVAFFKRGYNLAMFTDRTFRINVTLIYLPMCVTRPGIVLGKLKDEALSQIKKIKGYKMILNLQDGYAPDFATGLTCPKCILRLHWNTFGEYLSSLRSDYRNRMKKTLNRSKNVQIRFIDNEKEFTDELYQMYLNVLARSRVKIETLSREYFTGKYFKIFVAELDGRAVGFTQLMENGKELIFEFVGVDYRFNEEYRVYRRMLAEIIKYGIEHRFESIDFGQTADDIKLKLGCEYTYLYAYLHHSNPIIRFFCRKFAKKLEYKPLETNFHVFKGERS